MRVADTPIKILAVASSGGHWEQMMQIREAFADCSDTVFATTDVRQATVLNGEKCVALKDYSQSNPVGVFLGLFETLKLVFTLRPNVVISTGAAPGLLCLFWGKLLGAKTIWIDSIANSETMSLSGRLAKLFATVTLSQWEHLAQSSDVEYWGSVI